MANRTGGRRKSRCGTRTRAEPLSSQACEWTERVCGFVVRVDICARFHSPRMPSASPMIFSTGGVTPIVEPTSHCSQPCAWNRCIDMNVEPSGGISDLHITCAAPKGLSAHRAPARSEGIPEDAVVYVSRTDFVGVHLGQAVLGDHLARLVTAVDLRVDRLWQLRSDLR